MTKKKMELLFGEGTEELWLSESVKTLEMEPLNAYPDPVGAICDALANPVKSPPLRELAQGKKNACVVISDFTRPVPNRIILPPLLDTLEDCGIKRDQITILVATGMHRPNLGEELEYVVGRAIKDKYRIINHYCRDPESYRKIDEIDGAPIEINKFYLDSDLKILTGLIEPHYYAGYSGGRKSILPGLSSFETMKFMHSFEMIDHPNVTNCSLEGNPFHEYGVQVAETAGADFILNVVINQERKIAGIFAGDFNHAHLAGCKMVGDHSLVRVDGRVDMVISSGGGYPLDATFYQISKALTCSKDILKKGGTIIVACECREGMGSPEFCRILGSACSPQEFFEGYCDPGDFVIDQWCAQNIYQAMDHAGQVFVYSPGLSSEEIEGIGAIKIENLQETVDDLIKSHPNAIVIPEGPYVVGRVK
jgi:nickel-dependent lactate racemase